MPMTRNSQCLNYFLAAIVMSSCAYNDLADKISCEDSGLTVALVTKVDATSCKAIDGSLVVVASGGTPGYDFSLNNGVYQTNPEFGNLAPGSYEVMVKDLRGCQASVTIEIISPDSDLSAGVQTQSDTQCLSDNGSIVVTGIGGTAPYQYQLSSNGFSPNNTFSGLKHGSYVVIVKDAEDCQRIINVTVPRGNSGISYQNEIKPIFDVSCNLSGCHGAGTGSRDWTRFDNVQRSASQIKARTANKSMPIGGLTLTQNQIDQIGCWVDDGASNN